MLRSLTSGVSGVQAHQTLLDVVGDNIANVNTTGFKKSSVQFTEVMSQTLNSATSPGTETGGTNPSQVGLGVSVGGVAVDPTQGNTEYTGGKSDMAISGDGFFIVENGSEYLYSRAGNFVLDGNGDLVQNGTAYRLQGYEMTEDPLNPGEMVTSTELSDLNIPVGQKLPAQATSTVGFKCNLDGRVDTVLPMGFNANDTTTSGIIGDREYSAITFAEGTAADAGDFLNVTFTPADGSAPVTVSMALTGVNSTSGLPELGDATVDSDGAAIDLDGDASTTETLQFDRETGTLSLVSDDGTAISTAWSCELGGAMNYDVVAVGDESFLVEFNDMEPSGNRQMVLWGLDSAAGSVNPGGMSRKAADLTVNNDGTFAEATAEFADVGSDNKTLALANNAADTGVSLMEGTTGIGSYELETASIHDTTFEIYDSQGNPHSLKVSFEKVDNNQWRYRVSLPDESGMALGGAQTGLINFTADGEVISSNLDSVLNVNFGIQGTEDSAITLDFTGQTLGTDAIDAVTQFGSAFTTKEYYQDGYDMGILNDYSIGSDGVIRGIYDNGEKQDLFTVALAIFANSTGLEKVGSGAYQDTANSGSPQILKPQEGGAGSIVGNSLEASNVDLTEEFTNLIRAQRGFQASARVITTSDEILEELMALKR